MSACPHGLTGNGPPSPGYLCARCRVCPHGNKGACPACGTNLCVRGCGRNLGPYEECVCGMSHSEITGMCSQPDCMATPMPKMRFCEPHMPLYRIPDSSAEAVTTVQAPTVAGEAVSPSLTPWQALYSIRCIAEHTGKRTNARTLRGLMESIRLLADEAIEGMGERKG